MLWSVNVTKWFSSKVRIRRRGLMLIASTAVAGGISQAADPRANRTAFAANGDPILAGTVTTATSTTQLNGAGFAAFLAQNGASTGLHGLSNSGPGVVGQSTSNVGAQGISTSNTGTLGQSTNGVGVFGTTTNASGVFGQSANAPGVSGFSTNNVGVQGSSNSSNGVLGVSSNNVGVFGDAPGAGTGTVGRSDSGFGVFAESRAGTAMFGRSTNGVGVFGQTSNAASNAGQFQGNVFVSGDFSATGMKSALVPGKDGALVRYYCTEAPEAWFEDLGEAGLTNGSATVQLDDGFAFTVKTDQYHVFLTPYGKTNGLYVANRRGNSFDVLEQGNGTSNTTFGYRIMARRKDVEAPRLQRTSAPERPNIKAPQPGLDHRNLPKPPAIPTRRSIEDFPSGR